MSCIERLKSGRFASWNAIANDFKIPLKKWHEKSQKKSLFIEKLARKLAPFKNKFSRMSKSNSSTRSNSMETPAEADSDVVNGKDNVPTAIMEGNEVHDMIPSSPPPPYDFVLEENKLRKQKSLQSPTEPAQRIEIIHKSSKELYRAVAKQFGVTCKMSDQCRCFDCQSHYFDCEYEKNEQEKTDGGLGAGTPMFISEVMHGTACCIL